MILDSPCSIDGCKAHVDLVKAEFDNESLNWIHYFNCISGHHYIKIAGHLLVSPEEFYEIDPSEDTIDYHQPTLFDDDDDALN